ncbi:hypothetical protein KQX54_012044 [Cotesia glomerata]|uniref:Uncharacterized protein n=1 Tax=Cotesia glomerata TaxID=32391 RepID=A0AAV7IWL0_COTGL|nr:hypothetical protein KQX54_012044 [Cotesia glomerata]
MSAHINSYDYDSELKSCTVLHLAARNGNKAMLEILLKEGANVQARDETPLHVAITKENTEAVGLLIQHGAKNMAELWLKNCIDKSIKFHNKSSNENKTFYGGVLGTSNHFTVSEQMPLEYRLERFNNSVVAKGYGNFKSLVSFEGKQSDVEMPYTTQLLLIQCIFARDEKDETPLHVAITQENTEAVGLLIQHGADVHLVSPKW